MHCHDETLDNTWKKNLFNKVWLGLLGEERLRAVIFLFDAVIRLDFLEMEQVSSEHMLCIRVYSMQALTEQQDESG